MYRSTLEEEPKNSHANHNLGVLALGAGKPELSLPYFMIALEANPKQGQYYLSMIDALIKAAQTDNARKVLQQGRDIGLKGEKVDQFKKLLEPAGEQPVSPNPAGAPAKEQVSVLTTLYNKGQFEEVLKRTSALVEQFPKNLRCSIFWALRTKACVV